MERSRQRKSDVYRVEKLLDRRQNGRRVEYLVKWKNWSETNNTWEPEKNILDKRLIESFFRSKRRKEKRKIHDSPSVPPPPELTPTVTRSPDRLSPIRNDPKQPLTLSLGTPPRTASTHPSILHSRTSSHFSPLPSPSVQFPHSSPDADGKHLPSSSSTTSSSEPPLSPAHSSITSSWDSISSWLPERRFRPSTLMVAAASASAANTAAALASSRTAVKQGYSTHQSCTTPTATNRTIDNNESQKIDLETVGRRPLSSPAASANEDRPKIRLTIPRERLLACPLPPGNNGQTSLGSLSASTNPSTSFAGGDLEQTSSFTESDPTAPSLFLTPTELPRRVTTSSSPVSLLALRPPEVTVDATTSSCANSFSPKWDLHSTEPDSPKKSLPKIVLHNPIADGEVSKKRHIVDDPPLLSSFVSCSDRLQAAKKRKHQEKREKRKRRRDCDWVSLSSCSTAQSEHTPSYDIHVDGPPLDALKIRRYSGSVSTTTTPSLGSSPHLTTTPPEDAPRLAPLRIQLPRLLTTQLSAPGSLSTYSTKKSPSATRKSANLSNNARHNQLREAGNNISVIPSKSSQYLLSDLNKFRLVQEICVTDVTVGGLTVSIKECSGPDDFFGVPSRQLVHWIPEKTSQPSMTPLVEPNPALNSSVDSSRLLTSNQSNSCADENVAPCNGLVVKPRDLSTIYEESTVLSSSSSLSRLDSSCVKPEAIEQAQQSQDVHQVIADDQALPDTCLVTKSEPDVRSESDSLSSPSAMVLAATEEVVRKVSEAPSSPGLLLPPPRSSTPIDHSPEPYVSDTGTSRGSCSPTCDAQKLLPISIEASLPSPSITTAGVQITKHNQKVTISSIASSSFRHASSQPIQSRRPIMPSSKSSDNPKRTYRSKQSTNTTAVNSCRSDNHNRATKRSLTSASSINDPSSVYTFCDSSPTRILPPRSVAPRSSATDGAKSQWRSTNTSSHEAPDSLCPASRSFISNVTQLPAAVTLSTVSSPALPAMSQLTSDSPCTSAAMALYLQQLQMHILCTDPPTCGTLTPMGSFSFSGTEPSRLPSSTVWSSLLPDPLTSFLQTSLLAPDLGPIPFQTAPTSSFTNHFQLADMLAAATAVTAVLETLSSNSGTFVPSGLHSTHLPLPEEVPIDLSAKR